ncbi:hypothetical protein [uncultured Propionibacterium sp.]|uniref:hypothetical protein n=1 Tax=uncultured Propionibacterium sp. TaxID=218066 RepID=UPI00292E77B6|nr:hypothetical protein [uncultured Propionibacterium sp.]
MPAIPTFPAENGQVPGADHRTKNRLTIIHHRRNRAQAEPDESFDVDQSSISRAIGRWTPRLAEALED